MLGDPWAFQVQFTLGGRKFIPKLPSKFHRGRQTKYTQGCEWNCKYEVLIRSLTIGDGLSVDYPKSIKQFEASGRRFRASNWFDLLYVMQLDYALDTLWHALLRAC